jgi:hypothetical protein
MFEVLSLPDCLKLPSCKREKDLSDNYRLNTCVTHRHHFDPDIMDQKYDRGGGKAVSGEKNVGNKNGG